MPNGNGLITLRFLAEPNDVNFGGKVHGGVVMKWIDQAGYTCASGWAKHYCVTVYVGGIRFFRPIAIGHLVEVKARVILTGKTSMHIAVDVYSGLPTSEQLEKTTHCVIVFVGVDEHGKPIPIPTWIPDTEEEVKYELYAKRLSELRKDIEEEMLPFIQTHSS